MKKEHPLAQSVGIIGGSDGPTSIAIVGKRSLRHWINQCKRRRAAKKITAGTHTLDELVTYAINTYGAAERKPGSRIYTIEAGGSCFEIEIDDAQDTFGVSYSGSPKVMKHFSRIARDLYLYYGVSERDIAEKTQRYFSLLSVLIS